MMISAWLRAIRVRFLMASMISVAIGLASAWHHASAIDILDAALTAAGVLALHASVDLLNDYWDYRRKIDTRTKPTRFSGGSGVLPGGLLRPEQVYRAGIAALATGAAIGAYFVITDGPIVAAILGFAIISIYFYSGRIVDWGLGELFVGIKGAMIVLGTFFVQTGLIVPEVLVAGAAAGALSSLVLFVVSFPDYEADRAAGRRTLVILLGPDRARGAFWPIAGLFYAIILAGVSAGLLPAAALVTLAAAPLAARAGLRLRKGLRDEQTMAGAMSQTVLFGRTAGALLACSFIIDIL